MMIQLMAMAAVLSASPLSPLMGKLEDAAYITGSFVQTDLWALTLEEESSAGTMHLASPDLFRLSYEDPEGAATGYDGTVFYTLEPDLRQVIIYPSREPDSFLHLLEQCGDSTLCRTTAGGDDSLFVELEGDFGQGIIRMEVGFTLSDSLPYLFSTTDNNGNTTAYRLRDLAASAECPDGVFTLTVPEGYEVINPEEM